MQALALGRNLTVLAIKLAALAILIAMAVLIENRLVSVALVLPILGSAISVAIAVAKVVETLRARDVAEPS
jgi:hypothetical protein